MELDVLGEMGIFVGKSSYFGHARMAGFCSCQWGGQCDIHGIGTGSMRERLGFRSRVNQIEVRKMDSKRNNPVRLQVNGRETTIVVRPSAKESTMEALQSWLALLMEFVCGMVVVLASVVALWAWIS